MEEQKKEEKTEDTVVNNILNEDDNKYQICYGCGDICEIYSQVCSVCMRNGNYVYIE